MPLTTAVHLLPGKITASPPRAVSAPGEASPVPDGLPRTPLTTAVRLLPRKVAAPLPRTVQGSGETLKSLASRPRTPLTITVKQQPQKVTAPPLKAVPDHGDAPLSSIGLLQAQPPVAVKPPVSEVTVGFSRRSTSPSRLSQMLLMKQPGRDRPPPEPPPFSVMFLGDRGLCHPYQGLRRYDVRLVRRLMEPLPVPDPSKPLVPPGPLGDVEGDFSDGENSEHLAQMKYIFEINRVFQVFLYVLIFIYV